MLNIYYYLCVRFNKLKLQSFNKMKYAKGIVSWLILPLLLMASSCKTQYVVNGPQGKIATKIRLPEGFDTQHDSVEMVVLMHGIFSSKAYPPIPRIAKELRKKGIATITMDFGGHGKSDGKKKRMTIAKEIQEAKNVYEYVRNLPYVTKVSLLGHSQGGVIASMLAGELSLEGRTPEKLILLAPGAVIKEACRGGHFFGKRFDPKNPPEYIKCFGIFKLGREYLTTTQQLDIYGTSAHYQGPVCLIHGTKDRIVPLWCSKKYDSIYQQSQLHIIEGETHTMNRKLNETTDIIARFINE